MKISVKKYYKRIVAAAFAAVLLLTPLSVCADEEPRDYMAEAEARKNLPVDTDNIENWPYGPRIGAEGAILMDADTGVILYAKNIDERLYPASTTKIMTCMLAYENSKLDEVVTFSHDAVHSIGTDASSIGMDEGESITMQQALSGVLIMSANEVANAVAEHVGGSREEFVDMMNDRVNKMGLKNTHFCNPHGLFDTEHYTTAYDLATIARGFFSHEYLCNVSGTGVLTFEATPTQPDSFTLASKNQLMKGRPYEYEYLVGSKTGYTSEARQTLVSCAEKNGMKLICVILKEESPYQFADTVALFNYGFDNFKKVSITENDESYTSKSDDFLKLGKDVFGRKNNLFEFEEGYCIIPAESDFSSLTSKMVKEDDNSLGKVNYYFNDKLVGSTIILPGNNEEAPSYISPVEGEMVSNFNAIFIDAKWVIIVILVITGIATFALLVNKISKEYSFNRRKNSIGEIRKRRRYDSNEFSKYTFNGTKRRKDDYTKKGR